MFVIPGVWQPLFLRPGWTTSTLTC